MHPADYTVGTAEHDGWTDQDIFGWPEDEAEADTSCTGDVNTAHPPYPASIPSVGIARPAPVAASPVPTLRSAPSQAGEAGGPPRQGRDETRARSRLYPDPTHIQVGPR